MKSPTSFRLSDNALKLISECSSALGIKRSSLIELAIREFAMTPNQKSLNEKMKEAMCGQSVSQVGETFKGLETRSKNKAGH